MEAQQSTCAVVASLPHPPAENGSSPLPFFHLLERLKTTKREGWRRFGILQGESISDHMYRMSMMTMFPPPALAPKLDIPRCTKMALVHDVAESLVGDITPNDRDVPKTEKARREADVMKYISTTLLGGVHGGDQGIEAIFEEYEANETLEARFVHDIDKMELLLQTIEYERAHEGKLDLSEFYGTTERIVLPEMKAWADAVIKERDSFWADKQRPTS